MAPALSLFRIDVGEWRTRVAARDLSDAVERAASRLLKFMGSPWVVDAVVLDDGGGCIVETIEAGGDKRGPSLVMHARPDNGKGW